MIDKRGTYMRSINRRDERRIVRCRRKKSYRRQTWRLKRALPQQNIDHKELRRFQISQTHDIRNLKKERDDIKQDRDFL